MRTHTMSVLALVCALGVSGCNRTPDKPTELIEDNMTTEVPVDEATSVNTAEAPEPAPVNVTTTVAPPPAFTDTQQMRDDADATGLTSRLPTDEPSLPAANETQPAQ